MSQLTLPSNSDENDALMGTQYDEVFHLAVGGMHHVVKHGAMTMMLESMLEKRGQHHLSQRGKGVTGNGIKGDGLKGWLEKYAPKVNYKTALRFRDVAKAVQDQFSLPAKVRKSLGFAGLVTADPNKLDTKTKALQLELFSFVDGTSQRSWLDGFKQKEPPGGDNGGNPHPAPDPSKPPVIAQNLLLNPLRRIFQDWSRMVQTAPLWTHLSDEERRELDAILVKMRAGLLPKRRKARAAAAKKKGKEAKP